MTLMRLSQAIEKDPKRSPEWRTKVGPITICFFRAEEGTAFFAMVCITFLGFDERI